VIGTPLRSSIPCAAFANSVLVRTLDFNDFNNGSGQGGHPSDNIPVALAAGEAGNCSGREVLAAIAAGYQLYGCIQDLSDPASPWDHVSASALTTAAICGRLLALSRERLTHALALAAVHSMTLAEVRRGEVSAAKSLANGIVVQTAALLTLLAAEGVTGPVSGVTGRGGFQGIVLAGKNLVAALAEGAGESKLMQSSLKPYPCFSMAQGPIAAAASLHPKVANASDSIEQVTLSLGDIPIVRTQMAHATGQLPANRESADHSHRYLVAMALLEGDVRLEQFDRARWLDEDVKSLMTRVKVEIDPALAITTPGALPCRLRVNMAGGETFDAECRIPPGHPHSPMSWNDIVHKFRRCAAGVMSPKAQDEAIDMVARFEQLPSIRPLLAALAGTAH